MGGALEVCVLLAAEALILSKVYVDVCKKVSFLDKALTEQPASLGSEQNVGGSAPLRVIAACSRVLSEGRSSSRLTRLLSLA